MTLTSYQDQEPVTTEESSGDKSSQGPHNHYPSTNEESDGVINSPPLQTGGKEKPNKGKQQQRPGEVPSIVMSHFVPLSETARGLGLVENRVAPSDNDVQAILSYASVNTETHKDNVKSSDKQPPGGKGIKQEESVPSRKYESNKRSRKKHKARSQERETHEPMASHPKNLLPLDLIEQDDEDDTSTHVQQVSTTKLIIRPPKGTSEEQQPVIAAVKKSAKKKKKKDKSSNEHQPLKVTFKVQEDSAEVVQPS